MILDLVTFAVKDPREVETFIGPPQVRATIAAICSNPSCRGQIKFNRCLFTGMLLRNGQYRPFEDPLARPENGSHYASDLHHNHPIGHCLSCGLVYHLTDSVVREVASRAREWILKNNPVTMAATVTST